MYSQFYLFTYKKLKCVHIPNLKLVQNVLFPKILCFDSYQLIFGKNVLKFLKRNSKLTISGNSMF